MAFGAATPTFYFGTAIEGTFVRLSLTLEVEPEPGLGQSFPASQPVSLGCTFSRAFSRRVSGLAFELIATVGRAVIKPK